eukprot:scaffold1305_cov374-Prasinococcus_capsulatus_cf.AAC.12
MRAHSHADSDVDALLCTRGRGRGIRVRISGITLPWQPTAQGSALTTRVGVHALVGLATAGRGTLHSPTSPPVAYLSLQGR